jgi:hypothetical protein
MLFAFFLPRPFKLRPLPGSRVTLIPATTQGADVPAFGASAKGPCFDFSDSAKDQQFCD